MQIEIDFEAWKTLTALRESESDSYNNVVRRLLNLGPVAAVLEDANASLEGRYIGGRFLPSGTLLRAKYKSLLHKARIVGDEWQDELGDTFRSASAAAREITGNSVNGLTFWEAKRPNDLEWRKLGEIPKDVK